MAVPRHSPRSIGKEEKNVSEESIRKWLLQGKHLPEPLRDFHDQKAFFKLMHELQMLDEKEDMPNWVDGQIYVIDCFLWFIARRGYTLQRCRAKVPFQDLYSDLRDADERRTREFAAYLDSMEQAPPTIETT